VRESAAIHEYQCYRPELNFSFNQDKQNPEADFVSNFARVYKQRFAQIHNGTNKQETLFVREVPVSGNGIADLVVFSWHAKPARNQLALSAPDQPVTVIRSFEIKMLDWRKGLMQAHRYKYFSHSAILVLPKRKLKSILPHLDLFRKLRVGIWLFEPDNNIINNVYTPRPKQPQTKKYVQKVVEIAARIIAS
jgi:hypothetical protein